MNPWKLLVVSLALFGAAHIAVDQMEKAKKAEMALAKPPEIRAAPEAESLRIVHESRQMNVRSLRHHEGW